jgi:uncharacterized protein (TIGR02246 family)
VKYRFVVAVFAALVLGGCAQAPPPAPPDTRAADEKALRDDEAAWNKDWAAKDLDHIVSHYAEDASLEVPDVPILSKKDDMKAALKMVLDDPNWSISFAADKVEVAKGGDLAYMQGHYTVTETNTKTKKKVTEKGKYVTVYKKQADGSWKAVQDINNEDATPAPEK